MVRTASVFLPASLRVRRAERPWGVPDHRGKREGRQSDRPRRAARRTVEENPQDVPTLGGLLTDVQKARAGQAEVAETVFAADGHPTEIHIDWLENAIDDEADYLITEYRELP